LAQHVAHEFGIALGAHRGRSDNIGEECRHGLAFVRHRASLGALPESLDYFFQVFDVFAIVVEVDA
jgi:hypothetical protein